MNLQKHPNQSGITTNSRYYRLSLIARDADNIYDTCCLVVFYIQLDNVIYIALQGLKTRLTGP